MPWQECVQSQRTEKWCLLNLNKNTPKSMDPQYVETFKEAWEILDSKFGNAVKVSNTLIMDFMANAAVIIYAPRRN